MAGRHNLLEQETYTDTIQDEKCFNEEDVGVYVGVTLLSCRRVRDIGPYT